MGLKEVAKGFEKYDINKDLDKVLKIDDVEALILDLNFSDSESGQLKYGILSNGVEISSFAPYSSTYAELKAVSGLLTNNNPEIVNLYFTGSFYSGAFLTITKDSVIIDSRDEKRDELVKQYGEDIFGHTDENINRLINELLLELLQKQVRKSANEIISKISQ